MQLFRLWYDRRWFESEIYRQLFLSTPLFRKATMKCQTLGGFVHSELELWLLRVFWFTEIMLRTATCVFWKGWLCFSASLCSDGVLEVKNHLLERTIVFFQRLKEWKQIKVLLWCIVIFPHWYGFSNAHWKLVWSSCSPVICRGHWQLPGDKSSSDSPPFWSPCLIWALHTFVEVMPICQSCKNLYYHRICVF